MTTLDEIEKRANEATSGPWMWGEEGEGWGDCGPNLETVERGPKYFDGSQGASETIISASGYDASSIFVEPKDAVFIAHAREDVPKLVAALRAADEVAERLDMMSGHTYGYWARQLRAAISEALA